MKTVKITIEAPGSEGELTIKVTDGWLNFLGDLVEAWNDHNQGHSQPAIKVEELK